MPAKRDLTGLKVGKLTVIKENGKKNGKIVWQCKCECGNITNVLGTSLTKKDKPTQSCGCLQKEKTRIANQSEDLTGKKLQNLTVSTFHAFGVKILRQEITNLGWRENFSIYDETDRVSLIKECGRELQFSPEAMDIYMIGNLISNITQI